MVESNRGWEDERSMGREGKHKQEQDKDEELTRGERIRDT